MVLLVSFASTPVAIGDDIPVDPAPITIKLGEAKLFRLKDQGKVYVTSSASWRCGVYVLGEENTAKGVLLVAFVAEDRPIEVTVSSKTSFVVYKITVVDSDASINRDKEYKSKENKNEEDKLEEVPLQKVDLQPGESKVYRLPRGPVGTLCTQTWAICSNVLGDEETKRGFRVVGKHYGYGYVAVATSDPKDMKFFKFTVK